MVHKDAKMPFYATQGAAGADVSAVLDDGYEMVRIHPGCRGIVQTGLAFAIEPGYEIQVRPRSGLALKRGVTVLNTPGTIDSDYRGELAIILINHSNEIFEIMSGDRIAQIVVARAPQAVFEQVKSLSDSERGADGFGSTGVAA
jgi:dUTP pyrophosphatase